MGPCQAAPALTPGQPPVRRGGSPASLPLPAPCPPPRSSAPVPVPAVSLGGVSAPFAATSPPCFQIVSSAVGAAGAGERPWEPPW